MQDSSEKRRWRQERGQTPATDGRPLVFSRSRSDNDTVPLLCSNGVGVATFFWDYVGSYFSPTRSVVVWDYPGHGASAPPADPAELSIPRLADELFTVMDACAIERAVLLGHSLGCQVILEAYNRQPERVAGLVPMLGAYAHPADTFLHPAVGTHLFTAAYKIGKAVPPSLTRAVQSVLAKPLAWPLAKRSGLIHPDLARRHDLIPYLENLAEQDLIVFLEIVRNAQAHNAGPYLSQIEAPTLVVSGERDLFTPARLSAELAERIPEAEQLNIPRGSHAALVEQPELVNLRLEKFLRERVDGAPSLSDSAACLD